MALGEKIVEKEDLVKGRLVGLVVKGDNGGNNEDVPISNAVITLYKKSANGKKEKDIKVKSVKSGIEGFYRIDDIIPGEYRFTVGAPGYVVETVNVKIEPWITTNIHKLVAVKKSNKKGIVTGKIKSTSTGLLITKPIVLEFRRGIDPDLTENAEVIQSENGRYSIGLPAGNYTVTAKADGYITSTRYAVSYGDDITSKDQDIVISPKMIQGESSFRAVLTWGERPYDLDSHLMGPTPDGSKFQLYFNNRDIYYQGQVYSNLDTDDIYSYGPETITVNKLVDGTYDYYVHNYTNGDVTSSPQLSISDAMVQVYDNKGSILKTFNVPKSGTGAVWHVFTLIVTDNKYIIVPVDNISDIDSFLNYTKIPTDPIPEPPPNSTDSNESNQGSDVNSPNSAINEEEKETKTQSRKQSDIDSNNSDLEAKKDDSDN